jgi:hypothetical protein
LSIIIQTIDKESKLRFHLKNFQVIKFFK